ncbi:hypothetical protein WJX82_003407 [Trebouxia sp. C0006]
MQTPSGQGSTILLPVLGSQVQEAFSTDDAWSTQSLRDKMVRLHGMGVLQTRAGCLLVLNDKRIDPNQLQDLTFCRQRKEGQVRQTRGQWSPHKAAEQEICAWGLSCTRTACSCYIWIVSEVSNHLPFAAVTRSSCTEDNGCWHNDRPSRASSAISSSSPRLNTFTETGAGILQLWRKDQTRDAIDYIDTFVVASSETTPRSGTEPCLQHGFASSDMAEEYSALANEGWHVKDQVLVNTGLRKLTCGSGLLLMWSFYKFLTALMHDSDAVKV